MALFEDLCIALMSYKVWYPLFSTFPLAAIRGQQSWFCGPVM